MYCLDTDVTIQFFRGDERVKTQMNKADKSKISITPVTLCELYRGAFSSGKIEKDLALIEKLLSFVGLLDFSAYSCEIYGKIYSDLKRSGKLTQDSDLMIAAICITSNKTLVTRNKKHFENIKGLKIEQW